MNLFHKEMLLTVLYGTVLGFGCGLLYDVLRMIRIARGMRHGKSLYGVRAMPCSLSVYTQRAAQRRRPPFLEVVLLFCEDLFFCIFFACAIAVLIFFQNDGVVRAYALFACALGFFVYRQTLGRLVMQSAKAILSVCYRILAWLCRHTVLPLWHAVARLTRFVSHKLIARCLRHRTRRYFRTLPDRLDPFAGRLGIEKERK